MVVLALVVWGLVMISSVSVFESYEITKKIADATSTPLDGPYNNFYLLRHLLHVLIVIPVWLISMKIPLSFWKKHAQTLFVVSFILLLVLFTPLGVKYKGATGWINVPFLPSIQPAEIMKIGIILYLARWLEVRKKEVQTIENGLIPFGLIVGAVVFLLGLQPDYGSVLIILPVAIAMFFVSGGRIKHLATMFGAGSILATIVVMTVPYINNRFHVFLNPDIDPASRNVGWQIQQALIAIGSGGWFGLGVGKSIQKFGYLPEVQGDTIFSAMAEELGFIRIFLVIGAYLFIAYRGFKIADKTEDRYYKLVATGITTWIVWQAFVNILVNVKLFPLTGITLPFISYGGSSLTTLLIAVGILINISRYTHDEPGIVRRRGLWGTRHS